MISDFISKIQILLLEKLPGEPAHIRMAPEGRRTAPTDINLASLRFGSVLILLYEDNNRICFPLIRRPIYNGIHSGQISFPGGKREEKDKSDIATALRETHEEIGVFVPDENVLGVLSRLYIPPSNIEVLPVIASLNKKPAFVADTVEVEEIIQADLFSLGDSKTNQTIHIGKNISIQAPCFLVNNHVVWGATAMIINELLEIVNPQSFRYK